MYLYTINVLFTVFLDIIVCIFLSFHFVLIEFIQARMTHLFLLVNRKLINCIKTPGSYC